MWRIELSMIGSYAGRMQPPGSPNMTSTPSISRLLMRAWAPVSFMVTRFCSLLKTGTISRLGGREHARGWERVLRDDYENRARGHGLNSLAAFPGSYNPPTIAHLA